MKRIVTIFLACSVFAGGVGLCSVAAQAATTQEIAALKGGMGGSLLATSPTAEGGENKGIAWGFKRATADDPRTGMAILFINFGVLAFVLNLLLFKALRAKHVLNRSSILEALEKANKATANAEAALAEYRQRVGGLETEISEILATAQVRAREEAAAIVAQAHVAAEKIKDGAEATAAREAAAKVRALEAEVVDLAMDRAEALLREKFGFADQQSAITAYVGEVSSTELGGSVR